MPELPEVERAARRLRRAIVGRSIVAARALHPALKRGLGTRALASLRGHRIVAIDQRAKHQLLVLDDGRAIHAHFRMAGDWAFDRAGDDLPRSARAAFDLDDGSRLLLLDPRALSTLKVLPRGATPFGSLGPDPFSPEFDAAFAASLARRRGAIKPALLDQSVAAGVGNIYAAEALWEARMDPRRSAATLSADEVLRLADAIREVLRRGRASRGRYRDGQSRFRVYGREGEPCARCDTPIERVVQGGRSTSFCPVCQVPDARRRPRAGRGGSALSRSPRAARP
ncbi:MAG: formamidopyrimidine-DNA glycosylase [Gemmatimonadaceae bacterium]|nr:formamidopyrimidine-DNA glycosylase [Gemmatimonadaceae bacterium]NUR20047.1 formamidopyrimidine-DNA glycosylase [Gemmatimonadaceae bacterium]NUS96981.1 formamidopyrimidine-DNA glycosylase [Gemmatimonadaceae bacterium]